MYRWSRIALMFLFALLLLPLEIPGQAAAQDRSYVYDRIEVQLLVHQDGMIDVSETLTLRYSGGPFSKAERRIAMRNLDDITIVSLSEGTQDYRLASALKEKQYTVSVADGSTNVSWQYEPTSDSSRTFTLRYRVAGAVRIGSSDEIWWGAIFPERDVPVNYSRVTLTLPEGATADQISASLPEADGTLTIEDNSVSVVRSEPLEPYSALDLHVTFPTNLVTSETPRWQRYGNRSNQSVSESSSTSSKSGNWLLGMLSGLFLVGWIIYNFWKSMNTGDWSNWGNNESHRHWRSHSSNSSSRSSSSSSSSSSSRSGRSGGGGGGAG